MIPSLSMTRKARNQHYHSVAEAAARAERFGRYEHAGKLWRKAIKLARRNVNADWCAHRVEFCQSINRNGWSE